MNNMNADTAEKLTNDIFDIVAKFEGRETQLSISYLRELLSERGWKRLGNSGEFHHGVERLGFAVRRMPNTKAIRYFVTI